MNCSFYMGFGEKSLRQNVYSKCSIDFVRGEKFPRRKQIGYYKKLSGWYETNSAWVMFIDDIFTQESSESSKHCRLWASWPTNTIIPFCSSSNTNRHAFHLPLTKFVNEKTSSALRKRSWPQIDNVPFIHHNDVKIRCFWTSIPLICHHSVSNLITYCWSNSQS